MTSKRKALLGGAVAAAVAGLIAVLGVLAGGGAQNDPGGAQLRSHEAAAVPSGDRISRAEIDRVTKIFLKASGACTDESCPAIGDEQRQLAATHLIRAAWLAQEAERRGIRPTRTEMRLALKRTRARAAGRLGPAEIREIAMSNALQQAVAQRPVPVRDPSERMVRFVYANDPAFLTPERRELRALTAGTKKAASAARRALGRGMTWDDALRTYGTDPGLLAVGGRITARRGQLPGDVETRVFSVNEETAMLGPFRAGGKWWVIRVRVVPRKQTMSLHEARPIIKQRLRQSEQATKALLREAAFISRYRSGTVCADGLRVDLCANGPANGLLKMLKDLKQNSAPDVKARSTRAQPGR